MTQHTVLAGIARPLAVGVAVAIVLLASAVPIGAFIAPLAGHTTVIDADVVVSISFAVSLAANVVQAMRARDLRQQLASPG